MLFLANIGNGLRCFSINPALSSIDKNVYQIHMGRFADMFRNISFYALPAFRYMRGRNVKLNFSKLFKVGEKIKLKKIIFQFYVT